MAAVFVARRLHTIVYKTRQKKKNYMFMGNILPGFIEESTEKQINYLIQYCFRSSARGGKILTRGFRRRSMEEIPLCIVDLCYIIYSITGLQSKITNLNLNKKI